MKKFIAGILVGVTLSMSTVVLADNKEANGYFHKFKILINGKEKNLANEPLVVGDSSYLPVRTISEALGYQVQYETATDTISLSNDGKSYVKDESVTSLVNSGTNYVADLKSKYSKDGKLDAGLIKTALDKGELTVNSQDEVTGDSLLVLCIRENNFGVYNEIRYHSSLDTQLSNKEGKTPLHIATIVKNGYFMGQLLTGFRVSTNVKDNDGKLPIDYATKGSDEYSILKGYSN